MTGPSSLNDHLGYWLRLVSNAVSARFAAQLGERGIGVADWVLLRQLLDVELALPSRLAARMGMTRGGVSKLADRLAVRGLIERRANPDDGRSVSLTLTAEGRTLVPQLAALADENDAAFFGTMTPQERARLRAILQGIAEQVGIEAIPTD